MTLDQPVLLDVQHLSVDYLAANGAVHAVRDVSFTLRRGEILGLAGESGSGKSTLAFAIARLLRPPAQVIGGTARYLPQGEQEGFDILSLSPAQLRAFRWNELSIVFQSAMNALNPVMTVGKQIMDVLKTHQPRQSEAARRQRAHELLKLVGIAPDRLKSYPHELSGGMRQRVTIAIALALQPELIIMDEPTTALDVVVQREILLLISSLCKEFHTSLIFITHDLSLLLELSDTVSIMYAGSMVEQAPRADLALHPRHPYTYGLMNSFPTLHGPRRLMSGIPGSPPDLRAIPAGCPFHARCPFAFAPCSTVPPPLRAHDPAHPQQQMACHLYDPQQSGTNTLPDTSLLAQGYERLAERTLAS